MTTNLLVNPIYNFTEFITINEGEEYLGWTTSGEYMRTLISISGCDSVVTTNLQVIKDKSESISNETTHVEQDQMLIGIMAAFNDGVALQAGDRIDVFDCDICVGSVILSTNIYTTNTDTYVKIIINKDDGSNNGFIQGNTISFKIWDSDKSETIDVTNVEYKNDLTSWNTTGTFIAGSYAVVSTGDPLSDKNAVTSAEINSYIVTVYPNPVSDKVNIEFSQLPENVAKVILLSITGEQIINQPVRSVNEIIDMQFYPNGIYLVQTISGTNHTVTKVVKK